MSQFQTFSFSAFVRMVVDALEAAGVEYMLGGSVASSVLGEPRATGDVDVVVHLAGEQIDRLSAELMKRGMAAPSDIMRNLIADPRSDLPINAIHGSSGYKAEFFPLRPGDELRKSALQRRQQVDVGPEVGLVYLHSPEDLILDKVQYFGISRQTKHIRDVGGIVKQADSLDWDYLNQWMDRLGIRATWEEMLAQM